MRLRYMPYIANTQLKVQSFFHINIFSSALKLWKYVYIFIRAEIPGRCIGNVALLFFKRIWKNISHKKIHKVRYRGKFELFAAFIKSLGEFSRRHRQNITNSFGSTFIQSSFHGPPLFTILSCRTVNIPVRGIYRC